MSILFRVVIKDDIDTAYGMYTDIEACRQSGVLPAGNKKEAGLRFDNVRLRGTAFSIIDSTTMKSVGFITINKDIHRFNDKAYMLGYQLQRDQWGKGIAPQAVNYAVKHAFEKLGAEVVSASVFEGNFRSIRVMEKCGFRYEGTLRKEYHRFDGEYVDSRMYSMTRDEYISRQNT